MTGPKDFERIKREYPKCLLLFRTGDFYKAYADDAVTASKLLGLTIWEQEGTPITGFFYHVLDGYLAKLVKSGIRVAICEQA